MDQAISSTGAKPSATNASRDPSLLHLDVNPVPETARASWVRTPDGVRLRAVRFEPAMRPNLGTILILTGRAEAVEKYFETVEDFRSRGFGVVVFDWRGQGRSDRLLRDRAKGHVDTFDDYVIDLDTVIREVLLPDCKAPFYMVAHSMGGLIALLAGPRVTSRMKRMVCLAPLLRFGSALPITQEWLSAVVGTLSFLGFGNFHATSNRKVVVPDFIGNRLTGDPQRHARNRQIVEADADLGMAGPSIGWLHAACRAMQQVRDPGLMAAHTVPTLFVSAGNDVVVDSRATDAYAHALRAGALLDVPGAKHELLQERDTIREPLLAAIDAFVPGTDPI